MCAAQYSTFAGNLHAGGGNIRFRSALDTGRPLRQRREMSSSVGTLLFFPAYVCPEITS